jgi:hypothetical protein
LSATALARATAGREALEGIVPDAVPGAFPGAADGLLAAARSRSAA